MSQLSLEDCVEVGILVPTNPLIGWATEQLAATKNREDRLRNRGLQAGYFKEMKRLIGRVGELQSAAKDETSHLPDLVTARRVCEEAFSYWKEALQIVKVEFGSRPEIQAKFHLGVRTGRLISNLIREMEGVTTLLRAHSAELCWLGVDEEFLKKGEHLLGKLREAQAGIQGACRELSPILAEQCREKGVLYDLTRKLVRIGQLEFLHEPEQAAAFNYTLLRKELRAGSEVRAKAAKETTR